MSIGITIQNILLNGQAGPKSKPNEHPQITGLPPSPGPWKIPGGRTIDCEWVEWIVIVEQLQGDATTARLNLGVEMGVTTSGGHVQPQASPGTYNFSYTDARPLWAPIRAADYPDLLPDGDFPDDMATQTSTFPLMFKRRVRGGFQSRLSVTTSYTGNTVPSAFILTAHQIQRY